MHWGTEYSMGVSDEQVEIANYLSSLGVQLIIGTHPHVVEPVEYINDGKTLVIYSLGNFISAQIGVERLTGALVSLNITKTVNEDQTSSIALSDLNTELIYTYYKRTPNYWSEFKVIPYSQLSDEILSGYKDYYNKFSAVIKQYDNAIPVTSLEG